MVSGRATVVTRRLHLYITLLSKHLTTSSLFSSFGILCTYNLIRSVKDSNKVLTIKILCTYKIEGNLCFITIHSRERLIRLYVLSVSKSRLSFRLFFPFNGTTVRFVHEIDFIKEYRESR